MKIRVSPYTGSIVTNIPTSYFVKLEDPDISKFDTYKQEGTASYESTIGEQRTYSKFSIVYGDRNLAWSGLQFHKLTDSDWVLRLQEDEFLEDDFYFTNTNSDNTEQLATFGTAVSSQLDLTNIVDFRPTFLKIYEEAFCSIDDVKFMLRSNISGRVSIGEKHKDAGNLNLISNEEAYKLIRTSWARLTYALAKRYDIPIINQSTTSKELLKSISSKDVCYEIYIMFYPTTKFGEIPSVVVDWKKQVDDFIKNLSKIKIDGVKNKLDGSGGSFEFVRG